MGVFSPWGRWLEISAVDYQTVRIPLPEVMGPHTDLESSRVRKVGLTQGQTPENSFRDIAGSYQTALNAAFEDCGFEIEPDGRFAWSVWGNSSRPQEYGYLKQNEGEIELVPIPHPGKEIHP